MPPKTHFQAVFGRFSAFSPLDLRSAPTRPASPRLPLPYPDELRH